MMTTLRIGACQPTDIQNDINRSLETIEEYAEEAHTLDVKLLCFPECFLQGYIVHQQQTSDIAIDLLSSQFAHILNRLSPIHPMLVFGLIERSNDKLFNTAVVIQQGVLLGKYRKHHLIGTEKGVFSPGSECPIFNLGGLSFGINICNDLNFSDCAIQVSRQHAELLVCPCNNMMSVQNAKIWKHKHNEVRAQRCIETGLSLMSSDVTGQRSGTISYGPTAVLDPQGRIVKQCPLNKPGLLVFDFFLKSARESIT